MAGVISIDSGGIQYVHNPVHTLYVDLPWLQVETSPTSPRILVLIGVPRRHLGLSWEHGPTVRAEYGQRRWRCRLSLRPWARPKVIYRTSLVPDVPASWAENTQYLNEFLGGAAYRYRRAFIARWWKTIPAIEKH